VAEDEEREALKVESGSLMILGYYNNLQMNRGRQEPLPLLSGDFDGLVRH
jgi:hypothetical protein